MNELLVLGQIPGTNFQVTFTELLLMLDIGLILFLLRKRHHFNLNISYYRMYVSLFFTVRKGQQLKLRLKAAPTARTS